jgi:hypothetical protein
MADKFMTKKAQEARNKKYKARVTKELKEYKKGVAKKVAKGTVKGGVIEGTEEHKKGVASKQRKELMYGRQRNK